MGLKPIQLCDIMEATKLCSPVYKEVTRKERSFFRGKVWKFKNQDIELLK